MPYLYQHAQGYRGLSADTRVYLDILLHMHHFGVAPTSGIPECPIIWDEQDWLVTDASIIRREGGVEPHWESLRVEHLNPDDGEPEYSMWAEDVLGIIFPEQPLSGGFDLQSYSPLSTAPTQHLTALIRAISTGEVPHQIPSVVLNGADRRLVLQLDETADTRTQGTIPYPTPDVITETLSTRYKRWVPPACLARFPTHSRMIDDAQIASMTMSATYSVSFPLLNIAANTPDLPPDDDEEGGDVPTIYYTQAAPYYARGDLSSEDLQRGYSYNEEYVYYPDSMGWFPSKKNAAKRRAVWRRADAWSNGAFHVGVEAFLADCAAAGYYPSGAAALDALEYEASMGWTGVANREHNLSHIERMFGMPQGFLPRRNQRGQAGYIHPAQYEGDRQAHVEGCDCLRCHQRTCQAALHCERCWPQGPIQAGCRCEQCSASLYDDMLEPDDPDPWTKSILPPDVPGRTRFGIEIEFNDGNRNTTVLNLLDRKIAVRGPRDYTHDLNCYWNMTTDSTVSGGELVSPVMDGSDESIEEVINAIRAVKASGGTTGPNVGMHVHLDCTTMEIPGLRLLAKNLELLEPFLQAFVPKARYDRSVNRSARGLDRSEWRSVHRWLASYSDDSQWVISLSRNTRGGGVCPVERYVGVNWNSLFAFGTVEIRLLGHTLNTIKVRTWLYVLQAIMHATRTGHEPDRPDVLAWLEEVGGLDPVYSTRYREVAERRKNEGNLILASLT